MYCKFMLDGTVLMPCEHVNIVRKGDWLFIDFINNAFLPLKVVGNNVMLFDSSLFGFDVMEDDVICMQLFCSLYITEVDVQFTIADCKSWSYVECRVSGATFIRHHDLMSSYDLEFISRFCALEYMPVPRGCGYSSMWTTESGDYSIVRGSMGYCVIFPNGMKFPILRCSHGLVIDTTVVDLDVSELFVRCWKICDDSVRFRVAVMGSKGLNVVDNIELCAEGTDNISSVELMKRLFMVGCSHV